MGIRSWVAAGLAAGMLGALPAMAQPIVIGVSTAQTGPAAVAAEWELWGVNLAVEEINAAGGVLGKQIVPVIEDGASDWPTFAEKAGKLLDVDKVAIVFGCWTSASRKAVLPVFESLNGLLWYPVQYEGLEASPNIFYAGATTNQQIVPAVEYLLNFGKFTKSASNK